jgi:putative redox protein
MIASGLDAPYQTVFSSGVHSSIADVPIEKGGGGNGFGPHELLEAALATCLTMTARMHAAKHGLPLTGARSEVRIDRSAAGEATLLYTVEFEGELSEAQTRELNVAVAHCPVARTLTGKLEVKREGRTAV